MNCESESERLLIEPWQEKPGRKHTRTESLGESESERGKELELSELQGMCLSNPGINMMSRWPVRHADASGGYISENQHEAKEDQRQQVKNNRSNGGRHNHLSMKLRMHSYLQEQDQSGGTKSPKKETDSFEEDRSLS